MSAGAGPRFEVRVFLGCWLRIFLAVHLRPERPLSLPLTSCDTRVPRVTGFCAVKRKVKMEPVSEAA